MIPSRRIAAATFFPECIRVEVLSSRVVDSASGPMIQTDQIRASSASAATSSLSKASFSNSALSGSEICAMAGTANRHKAQKARITRARKFPSPAGCDQITIRAMLTEIHTKMHPENRMVHMKTTILCASSSPPAKPEQARLSGIAKAHCASGAKDDRNEPSK